jgi:hypothetical protein
MTTPHPRGPLLLAATLEETPAAAPHATLRLWPPGRKWSVYLRPWDTKEMLKTMVKDDDKNGKGKPKKTRSRL